MKQEKPDQSPDPQAFHTVELQLAHDQLNIFFPLFQKGVAVPAVTGCTLRSLLCDQFNIPADYVTDRITTIFLDNRPVDDLDRTIIQEGSRVTLSAAMPGLVGATMRRGGFYAALRQGISHAADAGTAAGSKGTIRIKLFNLLLAELGPLVLAHGLFLDPDEMEELAPQLAPVARYTDNSGGRVFLIVTFKE